MSNQLNNRRSGFYSKFSGLVRANKPRIKLANRRRARRLLVQPETLEERRLLATITWVNAAGGDWSTAANWNLNRVPNSADDVVIPDLGAPGKDLSISLATTTSVQSISNAEGVNIANGNLTLNGNLAGAGGVSLGANGILNLAGTSWTNLSTITVVSGTLNLGGSFDRSNLGTINRIGGGGTVNVTGTVTGGLTLNATTGPWYLRGGTINGGVITTQGTNTLRAAASSSLNAATIAAGSVLDMGVEDSAISVRGGLTIDGTLLLGNDSGSTIAGLSLAEAQTIGGTGTLRFGNSFSDRIVTPIQGPVTFTFGSGLTLTGLNGSIRGEGSGASNPTYIINGRIVSEAGGPGIVVDSSVGTLTTNGSITVQPNATFTASAKGAWNQAGTLDSGNASTINAANLTNTGTITTLNGTLNLSGNVSQAGLGSILRTGGTVNLLGTLTGGLNLDATTGPWYLLGGTIAGGIVRTQGNNTLRAASFNGPGSSLVGVTIATGSTLDMAEQGSLITVTGGLTLDGTLLLGNAAGTITSRIRLGQTQTIGGSGTLRFGNNSLNTIFTSTQGPITFTFGSALTVQGPSGTISGEGSAASNPTYIFDGPFIVDAGGTGIKVDGFVGTAVHNGSVSVATNSTLTMEARNWTVGTTANVDVNGGALQAPTTNLTNLASGVLAGGNWRVGAAGTLRIPGAITTNRASVTIDGPSSRIFRGATGTTDAIVGLSLNDTAGSLSLKNGSVLVPSGNFTNAGKLDIGSGSTLGVPAAPTDFVSRYAAEGNASDAVGTNHGTLINGAGFGTGISGQSFQLNGTDQYVSIADSPSLRPANLTISTWVNFASNPGLVSLVGKPIGSSFLDSYTIWYNAGVVNAGVAVGTASNPTFVSTGSSFSVVPGTWHNLAMTFNDAADTLSLYIDGVLSSSITTTQSLAYDTRPLLLGADIENGGLAFFFPGKIDETVLLNRSLSQSEINALYLSQSASPAGFIQSGGTTTVSGTLRFTNGAAINGGVVNGNGDIRSSVVNTAGTLAPGNSLGALRILGNYTQGSAASLNIEIGGTAAGTAYDQLNITGTATLGGKLDISLANGFGPSLGQTFDAVKYSNHSGIFSDVQSVMYRNKQIFRTDYLADKVSLVSLVNSSDLAAGLPTIPASATSGEPITIPFRVSNLSTSDAIGDWNDSVYLSSDSIFDVNDQLIGRATHAGGLVSSGFYNQSITGTIPGVGPGDYYVIVVADSRRNIPDTNFANNFSVSTSRMHVQVPALTLGTEVFNSVADGQDIYYRLPVIGGDDILLDATFAAVNAGEIYVKRGSIPTRTEFDFSDTATANHKRIVIANTLSGDYYVLVHGLIDAATDSAFTLKASAASFAVKSFSPAVGTNKEGAVSTIYLTGTKFSNNTRVALNDGHGNERFATSVSFENSNSLAAVFNLQGLPIGEYTLQAHDGNQLSNGPVPFKVTAGIPGKLIVSVSAAPTIRVGAAGAATVYLTNIGDSDVSAPQYLKVDASNVKDSQVLHLNTFPDGSIGYDNFLKPEDLDGILKQALNQIPGVIPPSRQFDLTGKQFFQPTIIQLQYKPTPVGSHVISTYDVSSSNPSEIKNDIASLKASLKPSYFSQEAWEAVWLNLRPRLGETQADIFASMRQDRDYLSGMGDNVSAYNELMNYEIRRANNQEPASTLATSVDAGLPTSGLPLVFGRSFMQSLSGRNQLEALGYGWTYTGDISLQTDSTGNVLILQNGSPRIFALDDTYQGVLGETGVLTKVGATYRLREANGTTTVFRSDNSWDYTQDSNGNRITAVYSSGRLSAITHSNNSRLDFTYNSFGRISSVTDSTGFVTNYAYDATGKQLLSASSPSGTVSYSYVTNQINITQNHALQSVTAADGSHTFYTYDAQGRLSTTRGDDPNTTLTYTYFTPGGYSVTDAKGATSSIYQNLAGLPRKVIDASGRQTLYTYNAEGRVTQIEDNAGRTASIGYDSKGNPISSTNQLGLTVTSTFDPTFNGLTSFSDARDTLAFDTTINFTRDVHGNLDFTTYPDGTVADYSYDTLGNVTRTVNRRSQPIAYSYNAQGLVTSKVLPGGATVAYTYDSRGNMLSASDPSGTINMTYDTGNRMTNIAYPNGRFVHYTYDALGRRTSIENQDGFAQAYIYDAAGRLSRINDKNGARIAEYSFDDGTGKLSKKLLGNNTYTTYSYYADGNLHELINHNANGAVNSEFIYTYDSLGRRDSMTTLEGTTQYGYDAIGQLTSVLLPSGRLIVYGYDAAGNRTSVNDSGNVTNYFANNLNQYTTVGGNLHSYDADGNLTAANDAGGLTTYAYDSENRLIGVTKGSDTWTYQYDALGNRIASTHNGQRTEFLIDPSGLGNVLAEYDSSGNLVASYTQGFGLTSRIAADSSQAFYDFDGTGSTAGLTNNSGIYVNSYSYLPFGESLNATESIANAFQYVGEKGVQAESNSLQFMRARFYSPTDGRFLNEDPIGIRGGANVYVYAENNPIDRSDPSGLFPPFTPEEILRMQMDWIRKGFGDGASMERTIEYLESLETRLGNNQSAMAFAKTLAGTGTAVVQQAITTGRLAATIAAATAAAETAAVGAIFAGLAVATVSVVSFNYMLVYKHFTGRLPACPIQGIHAIEGFIACDSAEIELPRNGGTAKQEQLAPGDPNLMIGPAGFGSEKHIANDVPVSLPYSVLFENKPSAAAAAADVVVTHQLDSDFDLNTFELTSFNFGGVDFSIPEGRSYYKTRIDARNTLGIFVDFEAGLDKSTGLITWTFHSLDPVTLDIPSDPAVGFLPPNITSPQGEGSVSYRIAPKQGLTSGTRLDAQSIIVFDLEAPIPTDPIFNTIDAGTPSSSVHGLPSLTDSLSFPVSWSGSDEAAGSGIATYDVFVSDNFGPFVIFQKATTSTSAIFTGVDGHTYSFYSEATDNVGHVEPLADSLDATTTISIPQLIPPGVVLGGSQGTELDAAPNHFTWVATDSDGTITSTSITITRNGAALTVPQTASGDFSFDALGLGTYVITAQATDNNGLVSDPVTRTVTVNDDDVSGPTIVLSGSTGSESHGLTQMFTWDVSDISGLGPVSVVVKRNSSAIFSSTSASGSFNFDAYGVGIYDFAISTVDLDADWPGDAASSSASRQVIVTNAAPTAINLAGNSIAENSTGGTLVGTLSSTDPDFNDSALFSLLDDAAGRFQLSGNRVEVKAGAVLDFESTPTVTIRVAVTDSFGASFDRNLTITLTNVNEAPTVSGGSFSIAENSPNNTLVGTLTANDPDANTTLTWSIVSGNVGGAFSIDSNGTIRVANSDLLDFETRPTYNLTIRAVDNGSPSLSGTANVTINLSNVTELNVQSVVVNGSLAGATSGQRSSVKDLTVTFNGVATISPGAFELVKTSAGVVGTDGQNTGPGTGNVLVTVVTTLVDGKTVAKLTFSGSFTEASGSLTDGNYLLTIRADKIFDSRGVRLDGNGDGVVGDNRATDAFFRLFGDTDGDRDVDNTDSARFRNAYGKTSTQAGYLWYLDFDNNGVIDDLVDNTQFKRRLGKKI